MSPFLFVVIMLAMMPDALLLLIVGIISKGSTDIHTSTLYVLYLYGGAPFFIQGKLTTKAFGGTIAVAL
jgi:hypothetical protein